jgi:hypothetical protein
MDPLEKNKTYTVGWISTLPLEMAAAHSMLDKSHRKPQEQYPKDNNSYFLGSIRKHNIVIACLSSYKITNTAIVVNQMLFSFLSIRFGLIVSIGSRIPRKDHNIRLGDIIVSKPKGILGSIGQYDLGLPNNDFQLIGYLNKPEIGAHLPHYQLYVSRILNLGELGASFRS